MPARMHRPPEDGTLKFRRVWTLRRKPDHIHLIAWLKVRAVLLGLGIQRCAIVLDENGPGWSKQRDHSVDLNPLVKHSLRVEAHYIGDGVHRS